MEIKQENLSVRLPNDNGVQMVFRLRNHEMAVLTDGGNIYIYNPLNFRVKSIKRLPVQSSVVSTFLLEKKNLLVIVTFPGDIMIYRISRDLLLYRKLKSKEHIPSFACSLKEFIIASPGFYSRHLLVLHTK